jgi:HAD superfamily hydrolase (TIGR01509 family)
MLHDVRQALLFDFGGTLDFPRHWLDRFAIHYRVAGIELDRADLEPAFTFATRKAYASFATVRHFNLAQLVAFLVEAQFQVLQSTQRIRHLAPASKGGLSLLKRQICQSFLAESLVGLAKTRPLLVSLASSFKIAVVSNFYGNLHRVVADAGLCPAVTVIADSASLGFRKPDPRIFAFSLAALGVEAHNAVMIGDSIAKDCAPARDMGMKTIWLRHREFDGYQPPSEAVDFTVDNLEELANLGWMAD